jgi:hypothetical protein
MATLIRKSPPICLGLSVIKLILGKLRFSKLNMGQTIKMQDDQEFTVFRHITRHPVQESTSTTTFIVSFKFSRLSHNVNRIASILPMLLITGFPGFDVKMYGVNQKNGYWQGMYQWQTEHALEEYKKSFVFRMMNKRAITSTLRSMKHENRNLTDFINSHTVQ